MSNLDILLSQKEPTEKKKDLGHGLDSIHITSYAYEKAFAYARLVVKEAKGSMECGGYLITPKDSKDRIVTDAFLARNQDVSAGLYTLNAEDVIKAGREINDLGYKVLGWWHSHGNMATFFSQTDDDGQRTMLNEIGAFNYITLPSEKKIENLEVLSDNGNLVIFDKKNPGRKYVLGAKENIGNVSINNFKLTQDKRIGFTYGLVVHVPFRKNLRKPYVEIGTRSFCGICQNSKDESLVSGITFFGDKNFVLDEKVLMEEVKERVNIPKGYFYFGRRGYGDEDQDLGIHRSGGFYRDYYGNSLDFDLDSDEEFGFGRVVPSKKKGKNATLKNKEEDRKKEKQKKQTKRRK